MYFIRNMTLYRNVCFISGLSLKRSCYSRFILGHSVLPVNRTFWKQRDNKHQCLTYLLRLSQSCQRQAHHSVKGWKMDIRSSLEADTEQEHSQNKKLNCCEEGPEAISHDVVVSHLQQCSSVHEQINELCSLLSLTPEDLENRRKFCQSLTELLRPYFPNMVLSQFGSGYNGLGFKGCDIDVAISVTGLSGGPKSVPPTTGVTIPLVDDVDSGVVPVEMVEQLPIKLVLRFVRRVLYGRCPDIKGPILHIKARCPILRFYNEKYNLFCDMSCENIFALLNSKVLRLIGCLDERVAPLLKVLRYWAKHGEFVGDIEMFNSYAFSLLVVYFLQNTVPPILPSTTEIIEKSDFLREGSFEEDLLRNDIKKFPPSKNTQTIAELLREFFFFFVYFDFEHVMCPRTSSSVPKWEFKSDCDSSGDTFEFGTINIQDPFKPSFNTTSVATERYCRAFMKNSIAACQIYQNKNAWVPSSNDWGLNLILQKSETAVEADQSYNFEIPLKSSHLSERSDSSRQVWLQKVSQAVIDAWEYGLLFQCTEIKNITRPKKHNDSDVPGESETTFVYNPILKVQCKAYHNVFSGRSNFNRLSLPENIVNNPLEMERTISLKVSQLKKEDRRRELFKFQCECVEVQRKDITSLLVSLTFDKNFPPVVAVFLKEYMPKIMQHLNQIDYDLSITDTVSACNSER